MTQSHEAQVPARAGEVLDFWIGRADTDVEVAVARRGMWFGASAQIDDEIHRRFRDTVADVRGGRCEDWLESTSGVLAQIIVLDQFPRNLFRATPDAFTSDSRALELSLSLQHDGKLGELGCMSRVFALMPMQHAEDLSIQQRSVAAYESLAAGCDEKFREQLEDSAAFARLHRDIVERFGRFPHRNAILGRDSTESEAAWLADDAPTFGQGG